MTHSDRRDSAVYERYVHCRSVAHTERVAAAFAAYLGPGDFVALSGPLGAGKSVIARAIGMALGVIGAMPSPTYTLMAVHHGTHPVYHMDLYRLNSAAELDLAGLTSYFESDGVCLVEWAERFPETWPTAGWSIVIEMGEGENRRISIQRFGHKE